MIQNMIAGAAQGVLGIGQMIGGLSMPKPAIPDYEIPQELYANMTDAEYWSFIGLPEAQKQNYIEQMNQQGATALSRTSSRKGGMGMISSIAEQQKEANKALLVEDSKARMANLHKFWDTRKDVAGESKYKYQQDLNKVMDARDKRDNMIGAGLQNFGQSFSTFAGAGGNAGGGQLGATGNVTGNSGGSSYNFGSQQAPTLTMPSMPTSLGK